MAVDDNYTVALLHGDGTDASTTITDESGKTWTAGGNAQIDTAQSKFGGASILFDGTGDTISTADSDDFYFSGDFTVDFWLRLNNNVGNFSFFEQFVDTNNNLEVAWNSGLVYNIESGGSTLLNYTESWTPSLNTWYHIAWVRSGNSWYSFVDGTQVGTTRSITFSYPNLAASFSFGDTSNYFGLNGWLEEIRISKGIARWTSNFTPPIVAYAPATGGFFY